MTRAQTLQEVAAHINPAQAQQFAAEVMHIIGSALDWGPDQMEDIASGLARITVEDGVTAEWYDQTEKDVTYWQEIGGL